MELNQHQLSENVYYVELNQRNIDQSKKTMQFYITV